MREPNFESYRSNDYFELDPGTDLEAKMNEMHQEIYSTMSNISPAKLPNKHPIVKLIINEIRPGLVKTIRTVPIGGTPFDISKEHAL